MDKLTDARIADFLINLGRWRDFCLQIAESSQRMADVEYAKWREAWADGSSRKTLDLMQRADGYRRSVTEAACGLAFYARVVSEPERIKEWLQDRVRLADGRLVMRDGILRRPDDQVDGDYRSFLGAFGLFETFVPDNGSVLCGLHELADRAAGVEHTRYMH